MSAGILSFMGKGEKVMFKKRNSKRWKALSLAVALYVGGGQLSLEHVDAADVTGGDVLVDGAHPAPTPIATGNAHDIPGTTDNRNVTGNKLTVDNFEFNGYLYGGYTQGNGDSTYNEVVLKNLPTAAYYGPTVYGGWSNQGNATNNTVTLSRTKVHHPGTYYFSHVYGGFSNNASADKTTGNKLKITTTENGVKYIDHFETMEFVLDNSINSGDTMLQVRDYAQAFDWSKIAVMGAADWMSGATGSKKVILYRGPAMSISNYNVTGTTAGNFEYGTRSNTSTPNASNVTATQIYFERHQFKNADITYNAGNPIPTGATDLYGGTSTLGNTTTKNKVTIDGLEYGGKLYGGYTQGNGDSTYNEVVLKNLPTAAYYGPTVYGGWSNQGNATNNTVTLSRTKVHHPGTYYFSHVYGGFSNNASADKTTGNKLKITTTENGVKYIDHFETMEFVLDNSINSGDTMLQVRDYAQAFDWSKITVKGLREWAQHLASQGIDTPTLTLYNGVGFTLNNYAPTIIGTRGDYEFGKRANGTLSGTTMTGAYILSVDGNRFQNAGIGQNVMTPGATTRDTYSGLSIYGNTTNHNELNITGGSHVNARAGYTDAQSGGSDFNTLNLLTGGTVTNGYAGYTTGVHLLVNPEDEDHPELVDTTKNADAKNNTVNIKGGTLNAGGKLYGGYIATNVALTPPNNVSAGNASGNTINIESGTFGGSNEIYGGYTNGTGKATGNTINLGKSDGSLNAPTLNNAFLYGGASSGSASDVMTDNTLNVNTQNITVRGVQNFGKTKFNLNSTTTVGNTLLTVGGGATTGMDWAGVEVNPGNFTFTPSTYDARLFTAMHNGSGISFSNYAPYGAKEKIVGDLEYSLDTDNHTGNAAQDVFINGFQFRNRTATYTETPAHE